MYRLAVGQPYHPTRRQSPEIPPFRPQAADAALQALYDRYPRTADLVRQRADVVCTGGAPDAAAGTGPDASP